MSFNIRELSRAYYLDISKTLIAERKVGKLPDFEPDELQEEIIKSASRFLRVVAPAGSGKTQTLTAKAVEILSKSPNARVLCLTFTNSAADAFKDKAEKIDSSISARLQVTTVNSFGYELLRGLDSRIEVVARNSPSIGRVYGILKELMTDSPAWGNEPKWNLYEAIYEFSDLTKSLGFNHRDNENLKTDYKFIEDLGLSRLIDAKLEECEVGDSEDHAFFDNWFPFFQEFSTALWENRIVSLEDQKYWAVDQLTHNKSAARWLLKRKFTDIFVDEFQDINILDLYFIESLVALTKASLVLMGDDDQCIYEWRGCTANFIQMPEQFFAPILNGETFETIELRTNYRCPKNIVVHSSELIARNSKRISKDTSPKRMDDANIRVIPLPAAYMTMNVVDELAGFLADKHPNHSVAIVARKKCQLVPIQILLAKRDVRFKVDTDLNVFAGEAFKELRALLELPSVYTKKRPASRNIADLMALLQRTFSRKLSADDRNGISSWLTYSDPKNLQEALIGFSRYQAPIRKGKSDPGKVVVGLHEFLNSRTVVECLLKAGDLKGFKKDFNKAKDEIFYSEPPFSHLADLSVNYGDDFESFLADIDRAISRSSSDDPRNAKIELMTALRTKGREFDTVIVLDVNEGIFPNKLSVKGGRLEEERRLFYVTTTRTKNNLLMFDSRRINGRQMSPSRFIEEMKLPKSCWLENPKLDRISQTLLRELKI